MACVICNKRKVRCRRPNSDAPCDNCAALGYECVARDRKRKHYCVVTEPAEYEPSNRAATGPAQQSRIRQDAINDERYLGDRPSSASAASVLRNTAAENIAPRIGNSDFPVDCAPIPGTPGLHRTVSGSNGDAFQSPNAFSVQSYHARRQAENSSAAGFVGRSEYLGQELRDHEHETLSPAEQADLPHSSLNEDDWKVLELRRAFDLPPRAVCESLIENFIQKCSIWMPVVDEATLAALANGGVTDTQPTLLLQSLFMAGSRMQPSMSVIGYASAKDFYNRAKVIFFSGYEKDPLTMVTAVTILQYWNPSGPEHFSIHNSSYWLRVGVGLAYQIGLHREPDRTLPDWALRRRLFWTLYARDCLLSAGQGRPRSINLDDCFISPPSLLDFPSPSKEANLFIAYVKVAGILGDLTQWYLRGQVNPETQRPHFNRRLRDWLGDLPDCVRLHDEQGNLRPYDVATRMLYLPYFTAVSVLYKPKLASQATGTAYATVASTLASSCVVRIFEDALARNQVSYGVAMHAIYLLVAGIGELSNYDYPLLWSASRDSLRLIFLTLRELSKKWQTATGTLTILSRLHASVTASAPLTDPMPIKATEEEWELVRPFRNICAKWAILADENEMNPTYRSAETRTEDHGIQEIITDINAPALGDRTGNFNQSAIVVNDSRSDVLDNTIHSMMPTNNLMDNQLVGWEGIGDDLLYPYGNWLLQDVGIRM